jgi:phosphopantothenoylcysteine decarboxylase/phosphopantothenate--cysteine ligase
MNHLMWRNAATNANVHALQARGVLVFGPDSGEQACGETGPGRMLETDALVQSVAEVFSTGSLQGRTVLVTAGPTRESIDPVRYLSNHSSGKMGYRVCEAAVEAGARVILVSGPVDLPTPDRVERITVESAEQMLDTVRQQAVAADIFIAAAAVADYRPVQVASQKIKKDAEELQLSLVRNPDILATVKQEFPQLFCVGFAAETEDLAERARAKLRDKRIDMVAANWVGHAAPQADGVFGSDTNALNLYWADESVELPLASKDKLARQLIASIAQRYGEWSQQPSAARGKVVTLPSR